MNEIGKKMNILTKVIKTSMFIKASPDLLTKSVNYIPSTYSFHEISILYIVIS